MIKVFYFQEKEKIQKKEQKKGKNYRTTCYHLKRIKKIFFRYDAYRINLLHKR